MSPGRSSIGGKSELELLYSRSECDIVSGLKTLPPALESMGQGRPFSSSPADAFPAGMSPGRSSIGGKSELELLVRELSDPRKHRNRNQSPVTLTSLPRPKAVISFTLHRPHAERNHDKSESARILRTVKRTPKEHRVLYYH